MEFFFISFLALCAWLGEGEEREVMSATAWESVLLSRHFQK